MKKIWITIAIITIITINMPSFAKVNTAYNGIIYVDDDGSADYNKIQDAINNASNGDTIFVYNGTYFENIFINKSITLIGENKTETIIDGNRLDNVVNIAVEDVSISGFTITNSSRQDWFHAGIRLTSSDNSIHENIIKDNMQGIFGKLVTDITIYENEFFGDSITFSLYDQGSREAPYDDKYFTHDIYDNTVNGRPIYYYVNQNDIVVPENAGQVIAVSCNNLKLCNLNLSNADFSCILANCSDSLIENIDYLYSDGMIWLIHSYDNIIQKNEISYNFEGICIDTYSKGNIVKYNNITNNIYCGIIIEDGSNFNTVYKNNFINNNQGSSFSQATFIHCFKNRWRHNYWDGQKLLPKIIFGSTIGGISWINFDWRPALKPYEIN